MTKIYEENIRDWVEPIEEYYLKKYKHYNTASCLFNYCELKVFFDRLKKYYITDYPIPFEIRVNMKYDFKERIMNYIKGLGMK